MKFISALVIGLISVSANASPTCLEPHQTRKIKVSVPAGQSTVSIDAFGAKYSTLLSCTFDGGNGYPMKQEHTLLCQCNVPQMVRPEMLSVQITNEADEKVQYAITVSPVK